MCRGSKAPPRPPNPPPPYNHHNNERRTTTNTAGLLPHAGGPVAVVGGGGAGLRDLSAGRGLEPQHGQLALALRVGLLLPGMCFLVCVCVCVCMCAVRIQTRIVFNALAHTHIHNVTYAYIIPEMQFFRVYSPVAFGQKTDKVHTIIRTRD